jgi:NAD(P)-dependent dehydrogenase (short-subunit alcohol dehydrogenase family)
MSGFLVNKSAIVTGGTRGIGRAITESLLKEGASVVICGHTSKHVGRALEELREHGRCEGLAADVTDIQQVTRLFEFADKTLGGLDILVNNAGIGIFRPVADLTPDEWQRTLGTNLTGVFYCCHQAVPRMRHRGGGAIINISSLAGKNAFAGGAAYNASKFGLNGFSEALMLDHRNDRIRVTYVMPGSVDTDFSTRSERASWKIAPADVACMVLAVLRMPEQTMVSRIEMRPSMPPK